MATTSTAGAPQRFRPLPAEPSLLMSEALVKRVSADAVLRRLPPERHCDASQVDSQVSWLLQLPYCSASAAQSISAGSMKCATDLAQ